MAHCAVGIQDFDQTLDCQVFSFLIDRSGFISAYFPKLFQVKVLGCINLGSLSFHIILCLSFWPLLFFLKNCRKFVRFILISTCFILYVFLSSLILFEFKERLEGTLGEFLQKIDPFLVILTIWHQLDVVPECFQNFRTHKWTQILNDGEGRTHNIIMLLICTFPNLADQSLTQRVWLVECAQINQLERPFDQFWVRRLNVDIFEDVLLGNPLCKRVKREVFGRRNLLLNDEFGRVFLRIFYPSKHFFEFGHSAQFPLKKGAFEQF